MRFVTVNRNELDMRKDLMDQYVKLRAYIYDDVFKKEDQSNNVNTGRKYRTHLGSQVDDKSSYVLLLNDAGSVIGGARIQTVNRGDKNEQLSTESREVMTSSWKTIFPGEVASNYKRSEIGNIIIHPMYRGKKILFADGESLLEKTEKYDDHNITILDALIKECVDYCKEKKVDLAFVAPPKKHTSLCAAIERSFRTIGENPFSLVKNLGQSLHLFKYKDTKTQEKELILCPINPRLKFFLKHRKQGVNVDQFNQNNYKIKFGDIDISKKKAIVFDWDETLSNSKKLYADAISYAFSKMKEEGHEFKHEDIKLPEPESLKPYFERIFGDKELAKKAKDLTYAHYETILESHSEAAKGALEFLSDCRRKGIKVIIATNNKEKYVRQSFDKIFGNTIIGRDMDIEIAQYMGKPEGTRLATVFRKLMDEGIKAKDILSVGDGLMNDFTATYRAGIILGEKIDFLKIGTAGIEAIEQLNHMADKFITAGDKIKKSIIGYAENFFQLGMQLDAKFVKSRVRR